VEVQSQAIYRHPKYLSFITKTRFTYLFWLCSALLSPYLLPHCIFSVITSKKKKHKYNEVNKKIKEAYVFVTELTY